MVGTPGRFATPFGRGDRQHLDPPAFSCGAAASVGVEGERDLAADQVLHGIGALPL
jgi:hypothetical protein